MKAHTQTIINVALAIAVTLLIYQNNQLQDNVETLKGYAQLDTDKAWERMDSIEDKIKINYENFLLQDKYNRELQEEIAELQTNMDITFKNFDITKDNIEIIDNKIELNNSTIDHIQDYLEENFGG